MKSTGNSTVFAAARSRYRGHLRAARPDDALAARAAAAYAHPEEVLKRSPHQLLVRGQDADLIFKFYTDRDLFSRWRHSRARRAWAAAVAMRESELPTIEVLGFVDGSPAFAPFTSCLVMRTIPDTMTLREWIRRNHRRWTPAQWDAYRHALSTFWLGLGRHGFYHDDTKALNILVKLPVDTPFPRFYWIDPESVHPGHRASRHQVLRNLTQLNGSLRSWAPDAQRLRFLDEVARVHPWLRAPRVETVIRRWTHRRLLKEKKTRCGP